MASFTDLLSSSSSVGFFGSPIGQTNKTISSSFKPLSSFSSISLRKKVDIQKRCSLMAKARSPKIYSNKDMSTVKKMQVGVNKLVDVVGGLLGPKRHDLVLMSKNGSLKTVNDGLSAAKEFELDDPIERLGVGLMREMASNMTDVVGHGTTTFMLLTQGLITEGVKVVASGADPKQTTNGIEIILNDLRTELKRMSKEVEDSEVADVAAVSAGNDYEIGNMIGEAMSKVGRNGVVVTLKGRKHAKNSLYLVEGMQFEHRYPYPYYLSPYFVTDSKKMSFDHENCKVLLVDKITNATELVSVLEDGIKGGYPIFIITEDIQKEALDTLVVASRTLGAPNIAVLKAPRFSGQYLDDIAILTGGTVIREEEVGLALENVGSEVFGFAAKVVMTQYRTTIVGDGSTHESLNRRVDNIRELLEAAKLDYEKEELNRRLAKLSERVAVIVVGADTEKEVEEKKLRFEVALRATKAAVKEGIVVGGGCALLRLAATVDSIKDTLDNDKQKVAADVVRRALSYPIKQIAKNAGVDGSVVIEKVLSSDNPKYGYNAATETYEDLMAAGIVDPTKMVDHCLVEAWYVVQFFTSNPIIIDDRGNKPIPRCSRLLL